MNLNKIAKKSIAIFSVLLLIFSLNISINVSATLKKDDNYGVAYDEFDNEAGINFDNCSPPVNGTIKLDYSDTNVTYDLNSKANKIDVYEETASFATIKEGSLLTLLAKLFGNPDLFIVAADKIDNPSELDDMAKVDSYNYVTISKIGPGYLPCWPMILFRFEIDHYKEDIDRIDISWRFGDYKTGTNLEKIFMFSWSYGDIIPYWNPLKSRTYPEELNATFGYLDTTINTNFISNEGVIDILIIGKPKEGVVNKAAYLYTDYVMIKTSLKEGYISDGWVQSKLINPSTIKGWERIFWSGSRPSSNSYIKIKVLDQSGIEIPEEDLNGNSEGFSYSPIDISFLDSVKYPNIILKALLHSDDIGFTPSFNSWGVLWQTKEGFYDSFYYDFRIDESYGVEIEREEIQISEFFSDWPIFGKQPDNTRAYVGATATVGINETYWKTSIDMDFGGGFRSPIVSNGCVYIASNDKKIYSFNLTKNPTELQNQKPNVSSNANYEVDSSVAVGNNLVIFATSKLNSTSNKIYALDITNLKDEKWSYPKMDTSDTICFSAAPTIANDRVFVTSWSGLFVNNPILTNLYNKMNNLLIKYLGSGLGLNYKLFALDINNGGLIWKDPVTLPAGSFSTPAVDNGLVFVGCENLDGPSLFAIDENSGEEVWNASIGMIGRSSPVVANDKVFVVSRKQSSIFTFRGDDELFALNAETGEVIWNITLANNTSVLGNIIKGLGDDNLITTLAPASTPAVYGNTLFVMSPSGILYALDVDTGLEKWNFNAKGVIPDLTPFFCASPAVVDDIVYITASTSFISEKSYIYALDNSKDGKEIWNYEIIDPEYVGVIQQHFVFASPVVTDGLVLVSERRLKEPPSNYHGRIQVIGDYKKNIVGKVYSVPIHVQAKKWWNQFNATCENAEENNTITFSIIDENGAVLKSNLDGDNNDISDIGVNVIQFCAELNINDEFEVPYPILKSWGINWTVEDKKPEFIAGSFRAGEGQGGWVNLNLKDCSIEVKDIGVSVITSGIDTTSGKYQLEYMKAGKPVTKWFNAECDNDPGVSRARIIANISKDLKDVEITDLKNIIFSIKDLAGNENTSNTISFKIDSEKPSSSVKNADSFLSVYNEPVTIEGEGTDDNSGIASMALYYRPLGSSEWTSYKTDDTTSPFIWEFENTSDYYEFCTVATDRSGNQEEIPNDGDMSFLFDMIVPEPTFDDKIYSFDTLPVFSDITFKDDYELESIDYRINFHDEDNWTNIASNINDEIYLKDFSLSQEDWDIMEEDLLYYMYFRITDVSGNIYITPSDTLALRLLKDLSPTVNENVIIDLYNFEEGGWDDSFIVTATIPYDIDVDYVNLLYSYSSDKNEWIKYKLFGSDLIESPFEWEFIAKDGSGYYRFKIIIYDTEGNFVESPVKLVNVTLFPTTLLLLFIIFIIILFGISIFVIRKIKTK